MKVFITRLLPKFSAQRNIDLMTILIAITVIMFACAAFRETLSATIFTIASIMVISAIGIVLPKKMILMKWILYEAAVLTAMVSIWMWLSENADFLGWWSFIIMVISAAIAGYIIIRTKFGRIR